MIGGRGSRVPFDPVPGRPGAGLVCLALAAWVAVSAALVTASSPDAASSPHVTRSQFRPAGSLRYADGAAPGFSGGFGEQSCDACHFEAAINTPPGHLALTGVPERFVPGQRYPVTVTLARPGMALGGFQLAARFEDGKQAGSLAPAQGEEKRVAIETQGGLQYANQRREGATPAAPDSARWALVWTAPDTPAPVLFHVAGNAADGDDSALGDYIFTALVRARPE